MKVKILQKLTRRKGTNKVAGKKFHLTPAERIGRRTPPSARDFRGWNEAGGPNGGKSHRLQTRNAFKGDVLKGSGTGFRCKTENIEGRGKKCGAGGIEPVTERNVGFLFDHNTIGWRSVMIWGQVDALGIGGTAGKPMSIQRGRVGRGERPDSSNARRRCDERRVGLPQGESNPLYRQEGALRGKSKVVTRSKPGN